MVVAQASWTRRRGIAMVVAQASWRRTHSQQWWMIMHRENESGGSGETFIHNKTQDETSSNPDDLNTRIIQINNQIFINNGGLFIGTYMRKEKKIQW